MDLKNVVAISCRTNTGEMFEVPVREFFGLDPAQNSLGIGVVPKSDGKAFIASDVTEGVNGQLTFKNYKSETSFTGIPVGILAFDANGRVVTVPFQQNQAPTKATTQESPSSNVQSTINKLPIWTDNNGSLGDSDITRDGESYSVGGTMPFWKWDVYQGSVNITQSSASDGFRLNGKLVVSYDPDTEELTIGNAVYTTTNIKFIKTDSIAWNASGGGSITDIAAATAGNYTLTKPAKDGTYALLSDITDTAWLLNGNALTASKSIGSTTNYDVSVIRNSVTKVNFGATVTDFDATTYNFKNSATTYATIGSNGLTLGTISAESTDVDKFLVSNAGLIKYRTGTQLLSDIGAFATPSGLTTNYVTKWNGTALANSLIFDNGTNVGVRTATPYASLHVTYSQGGEGYTALGTSATGRSMMISNSNPLYGLHIGVASDGNSWIQAGRRDNTTAYNLILQHEGGRLGVGTTSPNVFTEISSTDAGVSLRINSANAGITSSNYSEIQLADNGSVRSYWRNSRDGSGATIFSYNDHIRFQQGSAEYMRLTLGGNLGIGLTPSHKLDVNGTTRTTDLKITSGAIVGKYWVCTNVDGTGSWTTVADSYLGTWNASTNTPTIANGTGTNGQWYRVVVAGTWNSIAFSVGDDVKYNGSTWQRIPGQGYTLQTATSSVLGGIKVGSGLSIDAGTGILSVSTLNQSTTGSAATLTNSRNIAISGDLTWNIDFNGSANVTAVGTLATVNSNVGTFRSVTVNAKGLVTAATNPTTLLGYGITDAQPLNSSLTNLAALAVSTGIMVQTTGDGQFVVRSFTGTTDRISVSNGNGGAGNPTIDISSSYVGQSSITTLGTITTGTWNGGVIPILYGGTGSSTQNFVDLTTDQEIDGIKEFYAEIKVKNNQIHLTEDFLNRGGSVASYGVVSNKLGAGGLILDVTTTGGLYFRSNTTRKGLFDTNGLILSSSLGNTDVPTERLDVRGNIRYNTLLKPNNIAGTSGQFLGTNGTQDVWTTLTTSHISNLSSYNGFDNYFTETEANGRFVDFDTDQSINGIKSFADHINIGGSFFGEGIYNISGTSRTFTKISSGFGLVLNAGTRALHFAQEEVVYMSAKDTGLLIGTALNKNTFASEKLQVNGNIRYNTLLKPNNVAGTNGQVLGTNGTQDSWVTLSTPYISDLNSYDDFLYYYTKVESDARFAPISHTLDSHSNVTITSNSSGEILKWNGTAWINNTLVEAGIQSTLPSGTAGQFLIRNASAELEFFNLELEPTRLTKNKIAVGDSANYLSDYENFEFLESRFVNILKVDDSTKAVSFGMYGASSNSFISASGGSLTVRGDNGLIFSNFAGGGTLALTVDNDGKVGVTPLGTGGGGTPTLASTYIGYGSSGNALTGTSNFVYDAIKTAVYFNDSANYLYVGKSVSVSDMFEITAIGARGIQLNTDMDIVIKNNNHLYLGSGASNKRVHIGRGASYNDANHYLVINGETFSFSMDNISGWGDSNSASTPQVGDKVLFNVVDVAGNKRFVPQKINKKLASALSGSETVLIL